MTKQSSWVRTVCYFSGSWIKPSAKCLKRRLLISIVKSRFAVDMVTVKPMTTSIKDASIMIINVGFPSLGMTRNSIRNMTKARSENA